MDDQQFASGPAIGELTGKSQATPPSNLKPEKA